MPEKLTLDDLFALFGCNPDDTRWVGSADSAEYLMVVTYLVQRSNRAQAWLRTPSGGRNLRQPGSTLVTVRSRPVSAGPTATFSAHAGPSFDLLI